MDFNFASFLLGLVLAGAGTWLLLWSEKCTYAQLVAFSCCEQARLLISFKKSLAKAKEPNIESVDIVFPIENEDYLITLLPAKKEQSDVHITSYVGVYAKKHDLWLMIAFTTSFTDENFLAETYHYYFCSPNYEDKYFVKYPYQVDVRKYLIRGEKVQ